MSERFPRHCAKIAVCAARLPRASIAHARDGLRLVGLVAGLVVGLVLARPALALDSLVSAEQELRRMRDAASSLSYRGTATYEQAGALTTLKVTRAVLDGRRRERLEYLDGPPGEMVNDSGSPGCDAASLVDLAGRIDVEKAVKHYRAAFLDEGRIAGRSVTRLRLQPRDDYRYGHVLSIDRETGLMLQALTLDQQGHLMDRFQFSDIAFGVETSEADLMPRADGHRVPGGTDCGSMPNSGDAAGHQWVASWVPPGFVRFAVAASDSAGREAHYTDGFSSFSVFVEPDAEGGPMLEARHGPTMAYIRTHQGREGSYRITVVGEVPMPTARRIATGVELRPSNYPTADAAARAER